MEHSIKVAKAASIYAKHVKGVDLVKAERMALVHDLAEHEVPDFTPQSGIADADKHSLEKAAFEKLLKEEGDAGLVLLDLWLEYEAGTSPEVRIVKQLDKFDAVVQALVYEDQGYPRMQEFYDYTRPKLVDRPLIHIFEILMERDYAPARAYELYFDLLEANGDPQLLQKQYRKNR